MSKKIWIILGGVVLLVLVAGGAFWGGMAFDQWRIASIRNSFFANRGGGGGDGGGGGGGGGFFGGGGGGGFGGGGAGGRGAFGQIKSIDGDTLTLSTPQNVVTVKLTDSTTIQKLVTGARTDLQVGDQVTVRGDRDASGNITSATTVQIIGASATATPAP